MCDQTEVSYLPGNVVWVKIGPIWWPGKVIANDEIDEGIIKNLKTLVAVVKFFQEDKYEFVKNLSNIYHYNCLRKTEFIKKGLNMLRSNSKKSSWSMNQFPEDIATAEVLTNGNPNILDDDSFLPEEKVDYTNLFPSTKKTPKISKTPDVIKKKEPQATSTVLVNRPITHPRFIRLAQGLSVDYEARYLEQPPAAPPPTELKTYKCHFCDYTAHYINSLTLHFEFWHYQSKQKFNPKKSNQKSRSNKRKSFLTDNSDTSNERDKRLASGGSAKKVRSSAGGTTKKNKTTEAQKSIIDENLHRSLLDDWLEDEEPVQEQPSDSDSSSNIQQNITETLDGTTKLKSNKMSCFDFDDSEDSITMASSSTYRSMKPRLLGKRKISEDSKIFPDANEESVEINEQNMCVVAKASKHCIEIDDNSEAVLQETEFSMGNYICSNNESIIKNTDEDTNIRTITATVDIHNHAQEDNKTEQMMEDIIKNTQKLTDSSSMERINKFIRDIDADPVIKGCIPELERACNEVAQNACDLDEEFNECQDEMIIESRLSIENKNFDENKQNAVIVNTSNHNKRNNVVVTCASELELHNSLLKREEKIDILNDVIVPVDKSKLDSVDKKNHNEIKSLGNQNRNTLENCEGNVTETNIHENLAYTLNADPTITDERSSLEEQVFNLNNNNNNTVDDNVDDKEMMKSECSVDYITERDNPDYDDQLVFEVSSEVNDSEKNKSHMDFSKHRDNISSDVNGNISNINEKITHESDIISNQFVCRNLDKKPVGRDSLKKKIETEIYIYEKQELVDNVHLLENTSGSHDAKDDVTICESVTTFMCDANDTFKTGDNNSDREIKQDEIVLEFGTLIESDAHVNDKIRMNICKDFVHNEKITITQEQMSSVKHTTTDVHDSNVDRLDGKVEITSGYCVDVDENTTDNDNQDANTAVSDEDINLSKTSEESSYSKSTAVQIFGSSYEQHAKDGVKFDTDDVSCNGAIDNHCIDVKDNVVSLSINNDDRNDTVKNNADINSADLNFKSINEENEFIITTSNNGTLDTVINDRKDSEKACQSNKSKTGYNNYLEIAKNSEETNDATIKTSDMNIFDDVTDVTVADEISTLGTNENFSENENINRNNKIENSFEQLNVQSEKVNAKPNYVKSLPKNNLIIQSIHQLKINNSLVTTDDNETWLMDEETSSKQHDLSDDRTKQYSNNEPADMIAVINDDNTMRSEVITQPVTSVEDELKYNYLEHTSKKENLNQSSIDSTGIHLSPDDKTECSKTSPALSEVDEDIFGDSYQNSNSSLCTSTAVEKIKSGVKLEASMYDFDDDEDDDLQDTNMLRKEIDELISHPESTLQEDDIEFNELLKFDNSRSNSNNCEKSGSSVSTNDSNDKIDFSNQSASFIGGKNTAYYSDSMVNLRSNYSLGTGTSIAALIPGTDIKEIPTSLVKRQQNFQTVDVLREPKCSILMSSSTTSDNNLVVNSPSSGITENSGGNILSAAVNTMPPPPPPPPLSKGVQLKSVTSQPFKQPQLPSGNNSVANSKLGSSYLFKSTDPETGVQKLFRMTLDQQKILSTGRKVVTPIAHGRALPSSSTSVPVTLSIVGHNADRVARLLSINRNTSNAAGASSSPTMISVPFQMPKPVVSSTVNSGGNNNSSSGSSNGNTLMKHSSQPQQYNIVHNVLPKTCVLKPFGVSAAPVNVQQNVKSSQKAVVIQVPGISSSSSSSSPTMVTSAGVIRNTVRGDTSFSPTLQRVVVPAIQKNVVSSETVTVGANNNNSNVVQSSERIALNVLHQPVTSSFVQFPSQKSKPLVNNILRMSHMSSPGSKSSAVLFTGGTPVRSSGDITQLTVLKQQDDGSHSLVNFGRDVVTSDNSFPVAAAASSSVVTGTISHIRNTPKQDILAKALEGTVFQNDSSSYFDDSLSIANSQFLFHDD